ncbi:IS66 family insertion sequence element accessory protein TnpB [Herbaspirillum sp. RTI4]
MHTRIKVLVCDRFCIWLAARRLNKGRFVWGNDRLNTPMLIWG